MVFCLRVDIDTRKGLAKGVPFLRDLAAEYDANLSFYLPVGGESNLYEIIKHRKGPSSLKGNHIEKLNTREKIRTVLFPQNYAKQHQNLLKQLLEEDHEVGLHGYKHRRWTRDLESINIGGEFEKMIEAYQEILDKTPKTFAAPAFRTNQEVLNQLDQHGFVAASDLDGREPFHPSKNEYSYDHVQVPITLKEGKKPLIESLRLRNASKKEILQRIERALEENDFNSMYLHPSYEALQERETIKAIFKLLEKHEENVKTIQSVGKEYQ